MGLDNIPHIYPCTLQGVAIRDSDDRIDCTATQQALRCPYKNANPPRGAVYGMFGTDCWYRGKSGNGMLNVLGDQEGFPSDGFFGEHDERGDSDYCLELANWMADHAELFAQRVTSDVPDQAANAIQKYYYAVWWLRFVAKEAEGFDTWW